MRNANPNQRTHIEDRKLYREARRLFSAITGYDSDPAWYRFKKALIKLNLISDLLSEEQILEAVKKAARIRKELPSAGIAFESVLKFYLKQEELVKQMGDRTLTGEELVKLVRDSGIRLPSSTRSTWFEKLGGYSRRRRYLPHEIQHVLFLAAVYKGRKESQTNNHN